MNSHKIIIVGVLCIVVCSPPDALPIDHAGDSNHTRQTQRDRDGSQSCLDLQNTLRDNEQSQELLRDRTRIHGMLEQAELRQQMLQNPRFMRQLMQSRDMRQELLQNKQMMLEMLRDRDIHREINRNREMMEEIEKNETYRQINQEQEADILKDLLLESTTSGATPANSSH